jgi:hypothetical protein
VHVIFYPNLDNDARDESANVVEQVPDNNGEGGLLRAEARSGDDGDDGQRSSICTVPIYAQSHFRYLQVLPQDKVTFRFWIYDASTSMASS